MPRLALFLLLLLLPACDSTGGSQGLFEDEAYGLPPGTVSTWRVGPSFDARIRVLQAPTPDPASPDELVSLLLDVSDPSPGGYALYRLTDARDLDLIDAQPGQPQPAFYVFSFFGRQADAFGRPGTYRLMVLDAGQRVVAFGDFTIQ